MFSKGCEYAIRALIFISENSLDGKRVGLKNIAEQIDAPAAFTGKILQNFSKHGIIDSVKGVGGGYEIRQEKMKQVKLAQVVSIMDGDAIFTGCALGLKECNALKPCPVHDKFKNIRGLLRDMLETTTLYELSQGVNLGMTFLKR
ncbi:RrF2 family transcriptional regulator [Myroides sp. LJL119]